MKRLRAFLAAPVLAAYGAPAGAESAADRILRVRHEAR